MTAWRLNGLITGAIVACLLAPAFMSTALGDVPEAPILKRTFGPDGTGGTDFQTAGPTAVDQVTHEVYVADQEAGKLYKFTPEGDPLDFEGSEPYISGNEIVGLSFHGNAWKDEMAVDSNSHVVYVTSGNAVRAFESDGDPSLFAAGPGAGTSEIGEFTELAGVAVDAAGNIYASDFAGLVKIYAPSGEFITQIEVEAPTLLTVGPDGSLYLLREEGRLFRFTPSEVPVTPSTTFFSTPIPLADEGRALALAADPASGNVYVTEEVLIDTGRITRIGEYDPVGGSILSFAGPGEEGALQGADYGISIDGVTKTLYVSTNDNTAVGTFSKVEIFAPAPIIVGPPTVIATSAEKVSSTTATLKATINPNTHETAYVFEYGTADCAIIPPTCVTVPLLPVGIGAGHKGVAVSQAISGLQPNTTYHYRVVASNDLGATPGPDRTLTTQVSDLEFELPDERAWEMVSPPNKFGGTLVATSKGIIQATTGGDGLAYQSLNSLEADPDGSRAIEAATVLARRGAAGWVSKDISPPHTRATNIANTSEYNLFSPDLSRALLEPRDGTPLSVAASQRTPYLRSNTEPPTYTPLVTSKEGFANVPSGTEFGGNEPTGATSRVSVNGANPALTHIVLESEVPLAAGADPFSLYEWNSGQLQPVSVKPSDEGGGVVQGTLGSSLMSVRRAISVDGSRVFWGRGNVGTGGINLSALLVRDTVAETTARLDVKRPDATGDGAPVPAFQGASADGDVVFFTDSQELTKGASTSGRDLYRCEVGPGSAGCANLTDISAPIDNSLESADVQGVVSAISDDGTRVYFVARGALDEGSNESGQLAVSGEPNLYLWEEESGVRFVTGLSDEDDRNWGRVEGATPGYVQNLSAAASPSGRYFAFVSKLDLTESGGGAAAEPFEQVFLYDADTGHLTCVSCNPSGSESFGRLSPPLNVDLQGIWQGRRVAALLPEMMLSGGAQIQPYPLHEPRTVLDNGRVFFHAVDALVPADSNGDWDLYQYEPTEEGNCEAASRGTAIAGTVDACVSLLSAGTTKGVSTFLDASVNGDDVFFLTKGRLSVEDKDDVNDVYDARVGGVAAISSSPAACVSESCQTPLAPPGVQPAASESFNGPGNVPQKRKKHCPKGKRKVRKAGKVHCAPQRNHKQQSQGKHGRGKQGGGR